MVDRKITVVSVPRALCQPSVVLACGVCRLLLFSSLQLLNETSSLFSLIPTKPQSKKSAEMPNFCCLSDGNHAKPQSLAWCLLETINRAVRLKHIPVSLQPQPKVVRQSLNPSGCFGVCWLSIVATRNSKFCWVTCLVWGFIAEVPYFCIYDQMLLSLFLGASWPLFRLGRESWNIDYCFPALLILSEGILILPQFSKMLWNRRVNLYLCVFTLSKTWFIQIPVIWGPNPVISAW